MVSLNIVVLFAGWRLYLCCLPCNETAKSQKPTLPRAVLSLSWFSSFRQVCWEPQRNFSPRGPPSNHPLPSVPSLSSFWKKLSRSGSLCTLMFDPFGNALEWLKVWTRGLGSCCYCCWASNVVVWIGIVLVKIIGNAATLFFCPFHQEFQVPGT